MKLKYYIHKIPYNICWQFAKKFSKTKKVALYCEDVFDVYLFKNIQKHLKQIPIIAKNKRIQNDIRKLGYEVSVMPDFPETVIMFRNSAWHFSVKEINKIGFEHGAYNFKRMSKSHYYNLFNVFCMTSEHDVKRAKANGVHTAISVGFPKIDDVFDGSISTQELNELKNKYNLDNNKKTILFSATWDGSGMSGIEKWYNKLDELTTKYNILATIHPWMSEKYSIPLKNNKNIQFIDSYEILREILISDVCIGDTNSLIAEFCLLDKPIITFKVPFTDRTTADVIELIESASYRIEEFEELEFAINEVLRNNTHYKAGRQILIDKMLDNRDGNSGKRAADIILKFVPELAL